MVKYRAEIDGLRAVAVTPVVLYHAGVPGLSGGFIGVDVFFVISGFLITSIIFREISEKRFSIIDFYERRARRILPALVVVMLFSFVVGWFVLSPGYYLGLATSAVAASLFLSNHWFQHVAGDYFSASSEYHPLLHTWSLAVEEQFYIFFPLLMLALAWRGVARPGPVIAALSLAAFALAVVAVQTAPISAFYALPTRAWELGVGALLALGVLGAPRSRRVAEAAAALGLAAILAPILLYDGETPFPGLAAAPPVLGAAAIIWATGAQPTAVGALLSLRSVVFVGLISYSWYLWHWPLLAFARHLNGAVDLPVGWAIAAVAASLAAATASLYFVERPFRARGPAGFSRSRIFAASAAALAVVGAVSLTVRLGGGFPERLPDDVRAIAAAADAAPPAWSSCEDAAANADICRLGDGEGPIGVLLWGDSHALAAASGVAAAAERRGMGIAVAGKLGCPPLMGVDRADKGPRHNCAAFNDAVAAWLSAREDVDVVVLSARWALAAEGARAPGESGRPAVLASADGATEAGNAALFGAGLARTVQAVRAGGRRVVLLGGAPEIGWDVPLGLIRERRVGAQPPPPTLAEVRARFRRVDAEMRALAGADPAVRFVDLAAALCAPVCETGRDGLPLYSDDDHLSEFGARAVLPALLAPVLAPDGSAALR